MYPIVFWGGGSAQPPGCRLPSMQTALYAEPPPPDGACPWFACLVRKANWLALRIRHTVSHRTDGHLRGSLPGCSGSTPPHRSSHSKQTVGSHCRTQPADSACCRPKIQKSEFSISKRNGTITQIKVLFIVYFVISLRKISASPDDKWFLVVGRLRILRRRGSSVCHITQLSTRIQPP